MNLNSLSLSLSVAFFALVSDLHNILKQIKYRWKIKPTRIVPFTQNAEAIR